MNSDKPSANSATSADIDALLQQARMHSQQGQSQQAARLYQQILETQPAHAQALQYMLRQCLASGQIKRARQLLQTALRTAPESPAAHLQMAMLQASTGETESALHSLQQSIQLGDDGMAALHKGQLELQCGDASAALATWSEAWKKQPRLRQWRDDQATSKALYRLLETSASHIIKMREQALAAALDKIDHEYGSDSSTGIRQALNAALGKSKPAYAHAQQKPGFLYYPGLETRPFFPPDRFAWIDHVESAGSDVVQELQNVMAQQQADLSAYVQVPDGKDPAQWQALNHSLQWSSYHLIRDGEELPEHTRYCPATLAALQQVPLVDIPNHAPELFFSILQPGTHIPPHYGLSNYKLAVHLPLVIPPDCAIRVGDETHHWQQGKVVVFDDSFEHEAWNRSEQMRAVLIFEVWHPQLNEGERAAIRTGIDTLLQFNERYGTRLQLRG